MTRWYLTSRHYDATRKEDHNTCDCPRPQGTHGRLVGISPQMVGQQQERFDGKAVEATGRDPSVVDSSTRRERALEVLKPLDESRLSFGVVGGIRCVRVVYRNTSSLNMHTCGQVDSERASFLALHSDDDTEPPSAYLHALGRLSDQQ